MKRGWIIGVVLVLALMSLTIISAETSELPGVHITSANCGDGFTVTLPALTTTTMVKPTTTYLLEVELLQQLSFL